MFILGPLFETYLLDLMEFQDAEHFSFEESALSAIIPPHYHGLCDLDFARRLLICFVSSMERVRCSESPRCVAEEMAVKAIFEFTIDMVGDQGERDGETAEETAAGLEFYADNVLLEDADFEFLWEPRFDGLEHAVPELGMANLAFGEWFKPFREERPVNPYLEE